MAAEKEIRAKQWKLMKEIYDQKGLMDNPISSILMIDHVKYYQECCVKKCPHIKGVQFMLSGSKKEGGFEARIFGGKDLHLYESDVMVTLEGQILDAEEEDLLICNPEHLGFLCLKNPGQKWLDCFVAENEKDVPMVIEKDGVTLISTYFCHKWIEKLVKHFGLDKEKFKRASLLDPFGFFQKMIAGIGFEVQGPAHTQKNEIVGNVLPEFQRHFKWKDSKFSKPKGVDLMSQIVEEMDQCSLAIDNCQAVASSGVNICLDQHTADLKQDKILVYDKEDIKEYLLCPLKKMMTLLGLVKKFTQIEPFNFKKPAIEMTHYFFEDVMRVSKFFTDMRTSVEDIILWKIWKDLNAQYLLDTVNWAINSGDLPSADVDFVFSVKCTFWPQIAKPWIMRERPSDFPSLELCQEIASCGIHIVCKNYPSGDESLNWRLSFSEAEIKLVSMRSKKQKFVYFIFKSIFYEQLKSVYDEATDTSLSSYCIKTIMLWACEKHALEFWEKNSHLTCLEALFTDLEVALRTKNLPNYFIPEINLLADCEIILDRALEVVTKIQRSVEKYPSSKTVDKLIQQKKSNEKIMAASFEFHQQMPYLERSSLFNLNLFLPLIKNLHGLMGTSNIFEVNIMSLVSEFLTGKTIDLPASRPVPDHVFGIDTAGLQSLTRLVTGSRFGNSTFFEEIVDDLEELRRNDLLRSLVYRMLLVDVDLQIKLNDEVLKELKLKRGIDLELQKWFLYKLIKCMLSSKLSHELIAIANYVQGRSLLLRNTVLRKQTHDYGLIEECMVALEQWNCCDPSKEVQHEIKVEDIEHIEQMQSGTIHFSAILSILCHFETMINEGVVSPSSLAFIAVVKCMRRQMTERMKSDLVQMKKKPKECPLQEYEDIDLD